MLGGVALGWVVLGWVVVEGMVGMVEGVVVDEGGGGGLDEIVDVGGRLSSLEKWKGMRHTMYNHIRCTKSLSKHCTGHVWLHCHYVQVIKIIIFLSLLFFLLLVA